jgi:hypothetical protein
MARADKLIKHLEAVRLDNSIETETRHCTAATVITSNRAQTDGWP